MLVFETNFLFPRVKSPRDFIFFKAGVGDVYYCVMNNQINILAERRKSSFKGEKFKFQWKDNEIAFGKGGFFDGF